MTKSHISAKCDAGKWQRMTGWSTGRVPWKCHVVVAIFLLLLTVDVVKATSEYDPYKILGVSRSAGQAEIKRAYKKLVREW